jgi:hypothetical protein
MLWQATYNPCSNGHVFIWAGDPYSPLPDGYSCACGQTVSHTEKCPCCGTIVNKPIPIEGRAESIEETERIIDYTRGRI